jgi:hypothetical protein
MVEPFNIICSITKKYGIENKNAAEYTWVYIKKRS